MTIPAAPSPVKITVPALSLVAMIGCSGSGKSTLARRLFAPTEIVSSDFCRGIVSDDENDLDATDDAFDLLHQIAGKRLARGRLTVVDATSVRADDRKPLVALARRWHALPVAIVLDPDMSVCVARNAVRTDRSVRPAVVARQRGSLRRSLATLSREGFRYVYVLRTPEEADAAVIERTPLWCDRRDLVGPFDVIGDVHGCCDELEALLGKLGYAVEATVAEGPWRGPVFRHPEGRTAIFLGDLVDRGPRILDTVRLARNMAAAGSALCLPGNHESKLLRKLQGRDVRVTHGLAETLAEIDALPSDEREAFTRALVPFLDGLVSHYVLDRGRLVAAHAGMKQELQGRGSREVREFALYGETTGETDAYGLPVRHDWAASYRGRTAVVYGHTPVPQAEWLNETICVDTGCVFGGSLTALRWPERDLVSVDALRAWCDPVRPLAPPDGSGSLQQQADDVLDVEDVLGKRRIHTHLLGPIALREENAAAALEIMSRFAVNPRWLIYLPPTMSPAETSRRDGLLEHPDEALAGFRDEGVSHVICEEKHMGSRAVAVICRDEDAAAGRFGIRGEGCGTIVTRTGRRFFGDDALHAASVTRLRDAIAAAGLFDTLATDWLCLDCEIMPWSVKAQGLLRTQYGAVDAAARLALDAITSALDLAASRGLDTRPDADVPHGPDALASADGTSVPLDPDAPATLAVSPTAALRAHVAARAEAVRGYGAAWRGYCWPVRSLDDVRVAPFHVMAAEGAVFTDRTHDWHLACSDALHAADPAFIAHTRRIVVDLTDPASAEAAVAWWQSLTDAGGEGMVVKPLSFLARGRRGHVQPALKCRGREYLRIIYGPEYTLPDNLPRLRPRRTAAKRSLAMRELALGLEALARFVRHEPLRRVHECVFAVLAMETEPVDPRL